MVTLTPVNIIKLSLGNGEVNFKLVKQAFNMYSTCMWHVNNMLNENVAIAQYAFSVL